MTSYAVFGSDHDDRDWMRVHDQVRAMAQAGRSDGHPTFVSRVLAAARRTFAA